MVPSVTPETPTGRVPVGEAGLPGVTVLNKQEAALLPKNVSRSRGGIK